MPTSPGPDRILGFGEVEYYTKEPRIMFDHILETVVGVMRHHNQYPHIHEIQRLYGGGEECDVAGIGRVANFASNSYLGLSTHPRVLAAAQAAMHRFGIGSGGSRITAGTHSPHVALEQRIAEFEGTEASVVFSSGFLANEGILEAILCHPMRGIIHACDPDKEAEAFSGNTAVFMDSLAHRSMIGGIQKSLSGIAGSRPRFHSFKNNSPDDLASKLSASQAKGKLVVLDSVFSLHGRIAPIAQVVEIARRYGAHVYLDEAHATGIFGAKGRGMAEEAGVENEVRFKMGTLSKAIGAEGGFYAGKATDCDAFRVSSTGIFNTSMSPVIAAAATAAIDIIMEEPERRTGLLTRAAWFREEVTAMGYDILGSQTQIVPVRFYSEQSAKMATRSLLSMGIFAPPYYYPAVGKNEAMVRMNIMATHSQKHLDKAVRALRQLKHLADKGRQDAGLD